MRHRAAAAVLLLIVLSSSSVSAGMVRSHAAPATPATDAVRERLERLGLSREQADARLALLSAEDLRHLETDLEHLQTAGMSRKTKWIAITVVAIVVIVWLVEQLRNPFGGKSLFSGS